MVLNSKRSAERAERGLPEPPTCAGHKKDGTPCKKNPIRGSTVCRVHGGAAPQVRKRAQERLADHADILMAALLRLATSAESESVALAAIRDALDRAGFGAAQLVKLQAAAPWEDLLADLMDEEVLESVPARTRRQPQPRRIAPPSSLGGFEAQKGSTDDLNASAVQYTADAPQTIRGEVIRERHDYGSNPTKEEQAAVRRTARRAQASMAGRRDQEERTEYGSPGSDPSTDPTRPPLFVRLAMEDDGEDWRAGEGGGSRRADMGL